jgi:hypothetical protein
LNFQFNILNGVAGFDFQSNGLAGQGLDEDLHDENFFIAGVPLDSIYIEEKMKLTPEVGGLF